MKKFTAKIEVPGKPAKYLTNCIIYKGKLVQVYKKGVGESHTEGGMFNGEGDTWEVYESYENAYRTYFNQTLLKENGLTREEAVKLIEEDEKNAFKDERLFNSMFVLGKNPNGYEVINIDEEKEEKEKKEEKKNITENLPQMVEDDISVLGTKLIQLKQKNVKSTFKDKQEEKDFNFFLENNPAMQEYIQLMKSEEGEDYDITKEGYDWLGMYRTGAVPKKTGEVDDFGRETWELPKTGTMGQSLYPVDYYSKEYYNKEWDRLSPNLPLTEAYVLDKVKEEDILLLKDLLIEIKNDEHHTYYKTILF